MSFLLYLRHCLIFFLSCASIVSANSLPSSSLPQCNEDERVALLQFRKSFSTATYCEHPKVAAWDIGRDNSTSGSNCCVWDGVQCDEDTGHVVGLDLSDGCLIGTLSATNSLFKLVHLRSLNLANNDFANSKIPPSIGHFHDLRSLDLSYSNLIGQIPGEITKLSKLSTLNLSYNYGLSLHNPSLKDVALNLTSLQELDLTFVDISSTVPVVLANLSSLRSLSLSYTQLQGRLPRSIFQLPFLENLDLSSNTNLNGSLPEFPLKSALKELHLSTTGYSGKLPRSIGNLRSLNTLDLSYCNFEGPIPSSLGNLRSLNTLYLGGYNFEGPIPSSLGNLRSLNTLYHGGCNFKGPIPSSLGNLQSLNTLDLSNCNFEGPIPSSLGNLRSLNTLYLGGCNFKGPIPSSLGHLESLTYLDLRRNRLGGHVPSSFSNLTRLENLYLSYNQLTTHFDTFLKLKHLKYLYLDGLKSVQFSRQNNNTGKATPKFISLSLSNCSLTAFPQFLRYQNELEMLDLSTNQIRGMIPQWLLNAINGTSANLYLSSNLLTTFENSRQMFPSYDMVWLDLSNNILKGSFPPFIFPYMSFYKISNNSLTGNIPDSICNFSSLQWLDLSNNKLTGKIPPCIVEVLSNSMVFFNLKGNNFLGSIPQNFSALCQMEFISLSQNQLDGPLPRSLANCRKLQLLDLGRNHINDTFPSWLGDLQGLQVLILEYNNFHGIIGAPTSNMKFPNLRVISLSHNSHTGYLPREYIQSWHAMKNIDHNQDLNYLTINYTHHGNSSFNDYSNLYFSFNMTIRNKDIDISYVHILDDFKYIDLSSNKFCGEIPDSIGYLRGLKALNFSNNDLTGVIPSSLVNIKMIESLDLSCNKLLGVIPRDLTLLTSLEVFNVSYNHLVGVIPQGNQFDVFDNSSFIGNQLCGTPLSKGCGDEDDPSSPPPPLTKDESNDDSVLVDWIIRLLGYGSGMIIGFIIGKNTITNKHLLWLVSTLGRRNKKWIRITQRCRNL